MNLLRKIDSDSGEDIPMDGIKRAKAYVDSHYPYEFGVEYEYSTINPETKVENTIKIIPNGETIIHPEPHKSSKS